MPCDIASGSAPADAWVAACADVALLAVPQLARGAFVDVRFVVAAPKLMTLVLGRLECGIASAPASLWCLCPCDTCSGSAPATVGSFEVCLRVPARVRPLLSFALLPRLWCHATGTVMGLASLTV